MFHEFSGGVGDPLEDDNGDGEEEDEDGGGDEEKRLDNRNVRFLATTHRESISPTHTFG